MMSSWFSFTRLFYSFFLIFCKWSFFSSYYVQVNSNDCWDDSKPCYKYKDICLVQCPTLWYTTPDNPYTCTQPEASKRLIFNFHQQSSIIDDSNTPSYYSFDTSGVSENSLNSPKLRYQRGLYFSAENQYLQKNSGGIYLSLDYTWVFWARLENYNEAIILSKDGSVELVFNGNTILYFVQFCSGDDTSADLGEINTSNHEWNLYKIVQTYSVVADPLLGYSLQMWKNDIAYQKVVVGTYSNLKSPTDSIDFNLWVGHMKDGWLYQLIYIPFEDTYTWPQDYIENIFSCPKSPYPLCLNSCNPNEFYDKNTNQCITCNSDCDYCVTSEKCGFCNKWCSSTCSETKYLNSCDSNFCPENSEMNVDSCICNDEEFYYDDNINECLSCGYYLTNETITAGFSYDYSKVLFNFTIASGGSISGCSNLFDSSVFSTFGKNPTCIFNGDFTQLEMSLGSGFTFGGGNIIFNSGVLKPSHKICTDYPVQVSVSVSVTLPFPSPTIVLLAPSEIIVSCQNLTINGITNPGLAYEEYKWDIFSDSADPIINSFSTPYSPNFEIINIPQNLLSIGEITASLSVKNPFKSTTVAQKIIVSPLTKLVISFDSSIPETFSRLKSYSLSISSIWACSEISNKLKISWSIVSVSNNVTDIDEKSLWGNNTLSDRQLIIPSKVLPELATIIFHVHGYDDENQLEGNAELAIHTNSNNPVILFNRADGQIGVSQLLVIDASESYDPDGTSSTLLYQWICVTNSDYCSNFIEDSASKKLTVLGNSLSIGETYNFTFTITKILSNDIAIVKKSSKSIIIACIQEEVPIINIYEISQYFNRPNSKDAYSLGIKGSSSISKILWSVIKGPSIDVSTPLDYTTLSIMQGSLIQGQSYTLQVLINDRFPFTWSFNVNKNPSGGSLKVIPDTGTEMSTIFTIAALDWTDFEGDLPLQYSFGYFINNIYQVINSKNLTSIIYSQFPFSHDAIRISASISDSLSAITSINFTISISLQQDLDTEQVIYNLTKLIFASTSPPSSIPLYVSQITALSLNRQYLLEDNYSQINESIQNSYDIVLNAIFRFADTMNPYDSDSSEVVGVMLNSITQNPYINTIINIRRVSDAMSNLQAKILGKSSLSHRDAQTLVDVSNNTFQVHSNSLENSSEIVKEVDSNMNKINEMALEDMIIREKKQFSSYKINAEISKQFVDELVNFRGTVKNSSIILSNDIKSFLDGNLSVGTSLINYDPIPNEENATLSIVSFSLIDLSTSNQIYLNNISNQTISISAINFDPEKIYQYQDPPNRSLQSSTSSNGTYIYTLNCSYLENNDWKTQDCKLESFNQSHVNCKCTRLGIFTAMVKAIWISFEDNNAEDIINASALLDIDWNNAVGLYFVIGIIIFHSILSMKTLQMDWTNKNSIKNSEIENSSNIITTRSDDSIVNYYLGKQKNENSMSVNKEDFKIETVKVDSHQKIKIILGDHELIRIFMTHENYSNFSLATIYSTLILGNMFFIGLFYQNYNDNDNSSEGWTFNLKELIENYDFRDFWASAYATCFTFGLGIILNFLGKMNKTRAECIQNPKAIKPEKLNKVKIIIFYIFSYGLMVFFCWSIILFSIQFDLSISCKWIYNTVLNFTVDVLCVSFFKIALKMVMFWLLSKVWAMIRSAKGKPENLESQNKIASRSTENKNSLTSLQKLT